VRLMGACVAFHSRLEIPSDVCTPVARTASWVLVDAGGPVTSLRSEIVRRVSGSIGTVTMEVLGEGSSGVCLMRLRALCLENWILPLWLESGRFRT